MNRFHLENQLPETTLGRLNYTIQGVVLHIIRGRVSPQGYLNYILLPVCIPYAKTINFQPIN